MTKRFNQLTCKLANNELFLGTRNNVAQCCMQGKGWQAPDWNNIDDLNEWYKTFQPFVDVRNDLKSGIQNKNCSRCWHYENNNLKSNRIPAEDNEVVVKSIEVRFSNKCNLQCKMCDVNSSNQIQNLVDKLQQEGVKNHFTLQHRDYQNFDNKEKVLELILETDTIEYIQFAGGEPFVMPEVEWFINELIKRKKTNIRLGFITNVTSIKTKLLDKLINFDHVNFMCSIDGTEKYLEFQRYPAKWNTVKNNFDKLYSYKNKYKNITLKFSPCITQLNLLGIHDMFQWMSTYEGIECDFNILKNSSFLEYKLVPLKYREKIIKQVQNLNLDWLNKKEKAAYKQFFNHGMLLHREITQPEAAYLKDFAKVWDTQGTLKTKEMCPWIDQLIN